MNEILLALYKFHLRVMYSRHIASDYGEDDYNDNNDEEEENLVGGVEGLTMIMIFYEIKMMLNMTAMMVKMMIIIIANFYMRFSRKAHSV